MCQFFVNYPDGNHERPLTEIVKQVQDKAAELVLTGKSEDTPIPPDNPRDNPRDNSQD